MFFFAWQLKIVPHITSPPVLTTCSGGLCRTSSRTVPTESRGFGVLDLVSVTAVLSGPQTAASDRHRSWNEQFVGFRRSKEDRARSDGAVVRPEDGIAQQTTPSIPRNEILAISLPLAPLP